MTGWKYQLSIFLTLLHLCCNALPDTNNARKGMKDTVTNGSFALGFGAGKENVSEYSNLAHIGTNTINEEGNGRFPTDLQGLTKLVSESGTRSEIKEMEDLGEAMKGLISSNFTGQLASINLGAGGLDALLNHLGLGGGGGSDNDTGVDHHPALAQFLPKPAGSVKDNTPASSVLLKFTDDIEKVPGGGNLLGLLIKAMKNVTEVQIKEVTELLPLITAHPVVSNGGFLKLMAEMDSTNAGKELVEWAIGLMSNITYDEIQELTKAAPLLGPILMEQIPSLLVQSQNPNTTLTDITKNIFKVFQSLDVQLLSRILGNSSTAQRLVGFVSKAQDSNGVKEFLLEAGRPFLGDKISDAAKAGLAVMSIIEQETSMLKISATESFESYFEAIDNLNTSILASTLSNSSMSSLVLSYVARLQSKTDETKMNPECKQDLDIYHSGLKQLDMWALQMLDATGKPGSSLLKGAVKFFGNYDECLEIKTSVSTGSGSRNIKGSYCRLAFIIPQAVLDKTGALDTPMPLPKDFVPALEWHVCVPQSCDENTIASALSVLPLEAFNSSVYKVECTHDEDLKHDTGALVAVVVLAVLICLSLVGTIYDVITWELRRLRRKYGDKDDAYDQQAIAGFKMNDVTKSGTSNGISMVAINGVKVDNSDIPDSDDISSNTEPYEDNEEDREEYDGICRRLLLAFSLSRNTDKIFDTSKKNGSLGCIYGIRVLSMAWIILGHIIVYTKGVTDENITEVLKQIKDFTMQAVVNASLAVDTFFLISGCLVAYLFIQDKVKSGKLRVGQIVMYYVHRFWRLDPLYLVILMTYTCLFKYMMDGPLRTDGINYDNANCQSNWWTNALYINNVYKSDAGCMRWTWFMASDMQFYIIAPLALIPIVIGLPAIGIIVILLLFLTQIATYAYKEYSVDGSLLKNDEVFEEQIYFMPWCRVGVFAMGLLLGYILHKKNCKAHIPRFVLVIGWQLGLAIGLLCTYVTWSEWKTGHIAWSRDTRLIHETLARPGWALFVSWIIFVCCTGHGGVINRLLSWSFWIPLGRLTYGAYLIHPILITYTDFSKRSLVYVDFIYVGYQFIGTFVLSYALSFIFSVLVEAPCLVIEKVALGRFRKQH